MSTVTRVKLGRRGRRSERVTAPLPPVRPVSEAPPPVELPAKPPARGSVPLYLAAAAGGGVLMELARLVWN